MTTQPFKVTRSARDRAPTGRSSHGSTRHFIRHYAEMVVAMVLGMIVLGVPAGMALSAAGVSSTELRNDLPTLLLFGMAVTMTVPMVGWMAYRGHGWRANAEMSASMFLPTFAAIGLLAAGVLTDIGVLLIIEHVAMLLGMLGAMLLRPDEYRSHAHGEHSEVLTGDLNLVASTRTSTPARNAA